MGEKTDQNKSGGKETEKCDDIYIVFRANSPNFAPNKLRKGSNTPCFHSQQKKMTIK